MIARSLQDGASLKFTLLLCLFAISSCQTTEDCNEYTFISQPPEEIPCNPYRVNQDDFIMECSVEGPAFTATTEFHIEWRRSLINGSNPAGGPPEVLTKNMDGAEYDIFEDNVVDVTSLNKLLLRSHLRVNNIRTTATAGKYWCLVFVETEGVRLMSKRSMMTALRIQTEYQDQPRCLADTIYLDSTRQCVKIPGLPVSDPPTTDTTTHSSSQCSNQGNSDADGGSNTGSSSCSTTESSSEEPAESQQNVQLPAVWIIIISLAGGALVFVIHILLVIIFVMLCRKKRRSHKVTSPGISNLHPSTTTTPLESAPVLVPSLSSHSLGSTENLRTAPRSPFAFASSAPAGNFQPKQPMRMSLPSRSHRVFTSTPSQLSSNDDEEEYAPVMSRQDRRVASVVGQLRQACNRADVVNETNAANIRSNANDPVDNTYHSLDQDLMDDIQPYDATNMDKRNMDMPSPMPAPRKNNRKFPTSVPKHLLVGKHLPLVPKVSVDGEYVVPNEVATMHNPNNYEDDHYHYDDELTDSQPEYMAIS